MNRKNSALGKLFSVGAALFILLGVFTLALCDASDPISETDACWADPVPVGIAALDSKINYPEIAADPYGNIHIVTGKRDAGELSADSDGVVMHTLWDGRSWSEPIDIMVAPKGGYVRVEKLSCAENGQLHLLWFEANGALYWSTVPANRAESAKNWTTVDMATGATGGDLVTTGEEIAIVWIENNRDLVFQKTLDGGKSWSSQTFIWAPATWRQASRDVRMIIDHRGIYHLSWTEADEDLNWNPSGIWYARSIDGGRSWENFLYISDGGAYANVGVDAEGIVHLLWNHSVGSTDGRYHAWSRDRGETWSQPQWIFSGLSGQTGYPRMILDGEGAFHQLTSGRGLGRNGGIYHSVWSGDQWGDPGLITEDLSEDNNEGPAVALSLGNMLHVCWRNNNTIGDILCSSFQTSLFSETPVPTPLSDHTWSKEPTPGPVSRVDSSKGLTDSLATGSLGQEMGADLSASMPYLPVIVGLTPVVVLIGFVLISRFYRISRQHRDLNHR